MVMPPLRTECILCGGHAVPFFELPRVPVDVSALFLSAREAACARMARLALAVCRHCGGIFNAAWDPAALTYDTRYENSLDASALFSEYADGLARRLASTYSLTGSRIVEIGCGQARFLTALCHLSGSTGVGFDPSYDGPGGDDFVSVEKRMFSPRDAAGATMVLCRHVLEHLDNPRQLLDGLAGVLDGRKDTVLYFEVPNAAVILEGGVPWDLIYPHVSYFTVESLTRLLARAGFRILSAGTAYAEQFLYIEAVPGAPAGDCGVPHSTTTDSGKIMDLAANFSRMLHSIVQGWAQQLAAARAAGTRVALWGAGARGVTFLNTVPLAREIECVVDINPRKHNSFVPGTGQMVHPPQALKKFDPQVVIASNPIYVSEIEGRLASLGVQAELITTPEDLLQTA